MNRFYWFRVANYLLGFFVFGLICLATFPFVLFLNVLPYSLRWKAQPFARSFLKSCFAMIRTYCRTTGMVDMRLIDHRQGQTSPLIIANHISMFDIVLLFGCIPNLQTLVNAKFAGNPLMTLTVRACGYIPIKIGDPHQGLVAFERLQTSLKRSEPTALFPEGTRGDGELGRLKKGAFRLADDLQIAPSFLFFTSTQAFLNRQSFFPQSPKPVVLEAHIFAPKNVDEEKTWEEQFRHSYDAFRSSRFALPFNAKAEGIEC